MTTPEGQRGDERSEPSFADVLNNLYLDRGRPRRRHRQVEKPEPVPAEPVAVVAETVAETAAETLAETAAETVAETVAEDEWAGVGNAWAEPDDDVAAVRPYLWTGGRTRPVYDLAVETLVSTTDHGRDMAALTSVEHRSVAELCRDPRSVAEVAALLSLPLGVARVVLGDMAGIGLVAVHRTASSAGDVPDLALMERVLSGLRRL